MDLHEAHVALAAAATAHALASAAAALDADGDGDVVSTTEFVSRAAAGADPSVRDQCSALVFHAVFGAEDSPVARMVLTALSRFVRWELGPPGKEVPGGRLLAGVNGGLVDAISLASRFTSGAAPLPDRIAGMRLLRGLVVCPTSFIDAGGVEVATAACADAAKAANAEITAAALDVLVGVSVHALPTGEQNLLQRRVAAAGAVPILQRVLAEVRGDASALWTTALLTLAHLSMCSHADSARALESVVSVVCADELDYLTCSVAHYESPGWLPPLGVCVNATESCTAFLPLLHSDCAAVHAFACCCLIERVPGADPTLLWKAIAVADAVAALRRIASMSHGGVLDAGGAAAERLAVSSAAELLRLLEVEPHAAQRSRHSRRGCDLVCLLESGDGSDLCVVVGGDPDMELPRKSFRAHSCIVSHRCPFLCARLSTGALMDDCCAGEDRVISLPEIHPNGMEVALSWMYGGAVSVTEDNAIEAMRCADVLLLADLADDIECVLLSMVTPDNCKLLASLATKFRASRLRRRCSAVSHLYPETLRRDSATQ